MQKISFLPSRQLFLKTAGTKGMCTATDYPVAGPGHSGTAAAVAEKPDTRQGPCPGVEWTHQVSTAAPHCTPLHPVEDYAVAGPRRAPGADC